MRAAIYACAMVLLGSALLPAQSFAQPQECPNLYKNGTVEINEKTLNRLVGRLGALSASGTYVHLIGTDGPSIKICDAVGELPCPRLPRTELGFVEDVVPMMACEIYGGGLVLLPSPERVLWQWWVTDAAFKLKNGSMSFSASVRWRVGDSVGAMTGSSDASLRFDPSNDRLIIEVKEFEVPLTYRGRIATRVDVARLYTLSIPIEPQSVTVPMLEGPAKTVTPEAIGIKANYRDGRILVCVDMGF